MKQILVETSARHVHVNEEQFKILFGQDQDLTPRAPLSQPGQYVSSSRVDIVGPKKTISGVSILGPYRKFAQVEVSATDARTLGVIPPIRESGHIFDSAPIKIVGPKGELDLPEGCIIAKRHIHMTPKDAEEFGVKSGDVVSLEVKTPERSTIFGNVVVRVREDFALACHLDTDEANAAGIVYCPTYGNLIK
ncbi:MAG: phosphate propanoyltransferase [Erysipelotrichaceae bacterium]|jgi:putative phosphotransacetylase|nr:phosphate propanoyltransferase [Bacilli bacterium]NLV29315.1 phosphate propanoyltransferase [Erysipelotrichaceae bacterium]HPY79810.1 phosphate propanoyltransferase [Bacilli bacterium]HQA55754.1 phosphate propanoyltransferase [Bacilli bacterium]